MSAFNIPFKNFEPDIQQLLNQALSVALSKAKETPVMFSLYDDRTIPSAAETLHAQEVLTDALTDQVIYYGADTLIAEALYFVADDIATWIDGKADEQSEDEAFAEYTSTNGINVDRNTIIKLQCLARSLCPHAAICATRKIEEPLDDVFKDFKKAFKRQVEAKPVIDYGQNDVGIVVDGVMFTFAPGNKFVQKLFDLISAESIN